MAPRGTRLTRVVVFAGGLYRQRALLACAGYLGRDPMAQLQLRPGRVWSGGFMLRKDMPAWPGSVSSGRTAKRRSRSTDSHTL